MITKEDLLKELEGLPLGWQKFLREMVDELYEEIVRSNLDEYSVEQSKEKYGELRWYDYGGNKKTNEIVARYESISPAFCIHCGKPATKATKGWITYVCDECFNEKNC